MWLDKVTIAIKTIERAECLDDCLRSIRFLYPTIKIIVADDSKKPIKNKLSNEYYFLEFDCGVSKGKNFLLDKVNTEYVMFLDDDTLFTEESRIEDALSVLENNPAIDLVAASLEGVNYYGTFSKEGDILYRNNKKHVEIINGHKIYDYVIQLYLARTESIKSIKWNEELKTCDHADFFWRAKSTLKSTRLEQWKMINTARQNEVYRTFRQDRIPLYMKKQCEFIGVEKIVDREKYD